MKLAHQQAIEEGGPVAEVEVLGTRRNLARDQARRRGADAVVAQAVERGVDLAEQVRRVHDLDAGAFECRAVGFQCTVEIERNAVLAHDGKRLTFQDAEIGGVAQIVVLPRVAVEQQRVEALARHLLQ